MPRFGDRRVDVVLDVRTKLEYWLGHLPGAVQIPVTELERRLGDHPEIRKDASILVYCASGARSAQAVDVMRRMGYRRVVDGGGIATARAGFTPDR
ncbi:MAG TPA: rhodanese-like domain-containing protein [Gemmatimonadaceae bacterium]|nr:rhodanese-like domain-containing protein [Gemmatimonadaceae bacterium]